MPKILFSQSSTKTHLSTLSGSWLSGRQPFQAANVVSQFHDAGPPSAVARRGPPRSPSEIGSPGKGRGVGLKLSAMVWAVVIDTVQPFGGTSNQSGPVARLPGHVGSAINHTDSDTMGLCLTLIRSSALW
jgi:hypothetical protein